MAAKDRKRYLEHQEFKQWKQEKKHLRQKFEHAEHFFQYAFEQFKKKIQTGEISTYDDWINFECKTRIGTARMVMDEMDRVHEWMSRIPAFQFPSDWNVQILPGFMGAMTRFRVNDAISVYLDVYDRLGYFGKPYWEVYDGSDTKRFKMEDAEGVLHCINRSVGMQTFPKDIQELMQRSEEEL